MIEVLILEDEIKAAKELKALIEQLRGDIRVCALLQSVKEAITWFGENPAPGLILSDIQLSDGLCFELFRAVKVEAPVIFCTAYDKYALAAFESNSIDYLLKPIEKDKLEKSLEKFDRLRELFSHELSGYHQRLANLLAQINKNHISSLLVHFQNKIIPVNTQDINYIYARGEKVGVYSGNDQYEFDESMDELMAKLNPTDFYRANRQFIIHRRSILNIEKLFGRKLLVRLFTSTPETVVISKAKAMDFLKWVEGV
jgi:DNA-binding LytR/AlgR family response regulator